MKRKSTFNAPSLEEAARLFEAAARVKELGPWDWMDESEIFGVENPETGELGFVSVMGMAGEHFAVAVYQGAEGLYGIIDFASDVSGPNPEGLLDIPQLQASFDDRDTLHKRDRDLIKQLGLKFRGAHAWPMFRSYRPGYMPWFVTAEEARFITHALAQTLEVAPRLKDDPDLLDAGDDEESYLVRVPRHQGDTLAWEDQLIRVPPPEPVSIPVAVDTELLSRVSQLPQSPLTLEADFFSLPTAIGEKGERPYRPSALMLADGRSGLIVGFEMMHPEPSLAEMYGQIPMTLVQMLAQAGVVPGEIRARSELLLGLLEPLAEALNFRLRESDDLPSIDAATDSMFSWMTGRGF